jgi:aryl-alcohol dehydrogenase-like predicted oxidoreductase
VERVLYRSIERAEKRLSALGLGCWAIGGPLREGATQAGWGTIQDDQSIQGIRRALELGITLFDTADVYGAGHSERILGRALGSRRREVFIATKFGNTFEEQSRRITGTDASPEYIRSACRASLERLGTDHIDLYQFHLGDYDPQRVGEVLDTLEGLVREGKIRYYGWSTDDPERARLFASGAHCVSVQHQMNVLEDAPAMISLCEELGLASINRGPLAMGLLSGKYGPGSSLPADDVRGPRSPDWMKYFREGSPSAEWLARLEKIRALLTGGGRSLVQGALGWIWARSPNCIPIPGFKTPQQVEENARAMSFGPLPPESMSRIAELLGR